MVYNVVRLTLILPHCWRDLDFGRGDERHEDKRGFGYNNADLPPIAVA